MARTTGHTDERTYRRGLEPDATELNQVAGEARTYQSPGRSTSAGTWGVDDDHE
jgi:hypothetical protein